MAHIYKKTGNWFGWVIFHGGNFPFLIKNKCSNGCDGWLVDYLATSTLIFLSFCLFVFLSFLFCNCVGGGEVVMVG